MTKILPLIKLFMSSAMDVLTSREQNVLKFVLEAYMRTGQPIGSGLLAKCMGNELSSATLRNTMADLEEQGYLFKPHFTSGRIPTEKAFRYYIQKISGLKEVGKKEKRLIESLLRSALADPEQVMLDASRVLATASRYMGIVVEPRFNSLIFKEIEFVKLSSRTILIVLVTTTGIVETRIIDDESDLDRSFLKSIANYMNERFEGFPIHAIKDAIAKEIEEDREELKRLCSKVMELIERLSEKEGQREVYIEGKTRVLGFKELSDLDRLREVFDALEKKEKLLKLLDRCSGDEDFHVIMGNEWAMKELKDLSIVFSTYEMADAGYGILGILGPMRMDYARVIPIVSYTAKTVTEVFRQR